MSPKDIIPVDIAEAESIELCRVALSGKVCGQQDGPCQAGADSADGDDQAEEAEVEVRVEGRMLKDKLVGDLCVISCEEAKSRRYSDRGAVFFGYGLEKGARCVDFSIPWSDDDEYGKVDDSNSGGGYDGGEESGTRRRARVTVAAKVLQRLDAIDFVDRRMQLTAEILIDRERTGAFQVIL